MEINEYIRGFLDCSTSLGSVLSDLFGQKGANMEGKVVVMIVFLLGMILFVGCAAKKGTIQALLEEDYQAMADDELLSYYYRLSDEIIKRDRELGGTAVGTSVGFGGSSGGVSIGLSKVLHGGSGTADLRKRRTDVRIEMQKRDLKP